jgi:hypothetical protein
VVLPNSNVVSVVAPSYRVKISSAVGDIAANEEVSLRAFEALRGANELGSPITQTSSLHASGAANGRSSGCD